MAVVDQRRAETPEEVACRLAGTTTAAVHRQTPRIGQIIWFLVVFVFGLTLGPALMLGGWWWLQLLVPAGMAAGNLIRARST